MFSSRHKHHSNNTNRSTQDSQNTKHHCLSLTEHQQQLHKSPVPKARTTQQNCYPETSPVRPSRQFQKNKSVPFMARQNCLAKIFCLFHLFCTCFSESCYVPMAKFFFHGRLICGPDPKGLILTSTSIIISSWIFTVYSPFDDSTFISIFSLILTSLVFVNMILASSIDPGIIPRARPGDIQRTDSSRGARKSRTVVVNGVALKSKYCKVCNICRPPRSSHCAICDNCVEKFDHHCPWLGQCIGLRNYRFYLAFILSSLVFFGYILTISCWRIHKRIQTSGTGFIGLIKNWPETMALASFSFAAAGFSLGLSGLHLYLVAIKQTGYEKFRQRYATSGNPFDKGILSNAKEALFSPMPPSAVDFRGEVSDNVTLLV